MVEPRSHEDTKVLEPVLRFSEFNGSYRKHLFDELFEFSTGKNIKQNEASPEFEIPCVRYGELYHMYGEVISKTINFTNLNSSELKFSKGDEILLPSAGEDPFDIGSASALALKNIAIGRTINILSPQKEGVYSHFYMSYYINQKQRKKISRLAKGVSISNVYNSDLKKLSAVIPNIQEQQKIAAFLSSVDEKIEQLTEKHRLLCEYKKGIMQQIFTQQIRFKDNQGNDYPEWVERRLDEVAQYRRGSFPQPYGLPEWYDSENGFPFIQVFDIDKNMRLKPLTKQRISKAAAKKSVFIKKGTVIISIQGSIGRVAITGYDAYVDRTVLVFKKFTKPMSPVFFAYVLEILFEIEKRKAPGGTIKTITKEVLSSFLIDFPCLEEQQKIASFLTEIDHKINQAWSTLEQTKAFKKGLLQKMFI
ncbi:MAG: restriction endonuclease subunit S [Bacteroidota bacterium]|nr:restriction endonuclease subunit S [Bacteroidota bacterium]